MTVELALPRSAETRDMVDIVLEAQHVPADLRGQTVVVHGDNVVDASSSFADELVRMLANRHAGIILLVDLPPKLAVHIESAAKLRQFLGIRREAKAASEE
jgi:hypothetical protein